MRTWDLIGTLPNPPLAYRLPSQLVYQRQYGIDMTYMTSFAPGETRQKFKRRVQDVLLTMTNNASAPGELRLVRKFPRVNWKLVWKKPTRQRFS